MRFDRYPFSFEVPRAVIVLTVLAVAIAVLTVIGGGLCGCAVQHTQEVDAGPACYQGPESTCILPVAEDAYNHPPVCWVEHELGRRYLTRAEELGCECMPDALPQEPIQVPDGGRLEDVRCPTPAGFWWGAGAFEAATTCADLVRVAELATACR